eukprot:Filipodium_phascolosomae@DN2417_c0_g1_i4.p1
MSGSPETKPDTKEIYENILKDSKFFEAWIRDSANIPDLSDQRALVTGVSTVSGLGFWVVYALMYHGCEVIITGRNMEKCNAVKDFLHQQLAASDKPEYKPLTVLQVDNASFKSVKALCDSVKAKWDSLDIILNNAGVMGLDFGLTEDTYEVQFQTNHLSHFLIVSKLFPLVKIAAMKNGPFIPTISQVSSRLAEVSEPTIHFEDVNVEEPPQSSWMGKQQLRLMGGIENMSRYAQSKFANQVFAKELAEKIAASSDLKGKIYSTVCHPGGAKTDLQQKVSGFGAIRNTLLNAVMQSSADGSLPLLMSIVSPTRSNGGFYGPVKGTTGLPIQVGVIGIAFADWSCF